LLDGLGALKAQVQCALEEEVDAAQAAMFVRRFGAVVERLGHLGSDDVARVLRVALIGRVFELAHGEGMLPRALRVRAAVDYFYSLGAIRHHALLREREGRPADSLDALIARARWRDVANGVRWGRLTGDTEDGPIHANVLTIQRDVARLAAADLRPEVAAGRSFAEVVTDRGAVAGVSGGFFLYSEPDIQAPSERFDPVGLLVAKGEVLSPPLFRRGAILQLSDGCWSIGTPGLSGVRLRTSELSVVLSAVNKPGSMKESAVAFTRAWGRQAPKGLGPSMTVVGRRVVEVAPGGRALEVPLNGVVVTFPEGFPAILKREDTVAWSLPVDEEGRQILEGIAGGPLLLLDGETHIDMVAEDFVGSAPPQTFSGDETGDQNLLPRLAVGLDAQGGLVLAAVDGRNFERALGLSLQGTANLMRALGCELASNLDGGSSKRMVVSGQVVDLPSTEVVAKGDAADVTVRPVHTALLLHPAG